MWLLSSVGFLSKNQISKQDSWEGAVYKKKLLQPSFNLK